MCQPLPTGDFQKLTFLEDYTKEQILEDLLETPDEFESGFL